MSQTHSNVGAGNLYVAGDQRNISRAEAQQQHEPYKEGVPHSHKNLDSKDGRSIANRLNAQERKDDPSHHHNREYDPEAELSKQDPTKPAVLHGHEPSKGAKIDKEIQQEEQEILKKKGVA
ncbi:hypothetical protein P168DRAFT_290674 [Aspergillus campestris IBT 28561]|uniref:Uncharacterized protein n=1 Tax=Aspergillus campestris (strain IBT 28561) TaxID=1392248 RepID=A0A2I1D0W3_ASPC2|nr:uncharacterized protein P168DRAFT_290674 [Aspergillus campestris IBT 28561]PKY03510.1 hypothetical protein P168DRAFT_290674 [Aspergillus campestris IBT 28561]